MVPDRPSALSIPTSSGVEQNIAVEMICPYEAGKPLREVERELGLTDVTKLASNENPLGPSPRVIDTLNGSRLDLHAYPDYDGWYLRRAVAERLGVAVESVLIGAGSSDLMRVVADAYLAPGNEALVSDICFPVYANLARLAGAEVVAVPLDDDLQYDLERMLGAVTDRTKVVFLASPNNPTGLEIPADELELFLQRIPSGVLCVVDLAYREYVDSAADRDPLDLLRRHPNVLLLHTFSKVYGLAGLRVGYAVAPRDVIATLARVRVPFSASTPAQVAGRVALEDLEHTAESVRLNRVMRAYLGSALRDLGLRTWPSAANFVLADTGLVSDAVFQAMLHRGVIVRPLHDPRLSTCLRITTGTEEQMDRAVGVLEEVLKQLR